MAESVKITYLKDISKTSVDNINATNTTVNLCIYSIYDASEPYVLYLLHKLNNQFYWPHFNTTQTDLIDYHEYLNQMNITQYEFQGTLEENDQLYLFIKLENNFEYNKSYNNNNINWFVSIYEILLPRMCYKYKIHSSVTEVFINNISTRYLYRKNNRVTLPEVAYYPTSEVKKEYNTYTGLESTRGTNIMLYNYDTFSPHSYIRVAIFLYNYIVPNTIPDKNAQKVREITLDNDDYQILSCHGI